MDNAEAWFFDEPCTEWLEWCQENQKGAAGTREFIAIVSFFAQPVVDSEEERGRTMAQAHVWSPRHASFSNHIELTSSRSRSTGSGLSVPRHPSVGASSVFSEHLAEVSESDYRKRRRRGRAAFVQ